MTCTRADKKSENARCHEFRIELDGLVAQLVRCDCLQTLTSLREITVSLDPSGERTKRQVSEVHSLAMNASCRT